MDCANGVVQARLAAAVDGLTEEQHGAPVGLAAACAAIDAEVERVKNGRARVTVVKVGNRLGCRIRIVGEILFQARLAVKSDHSNAMWHAANDRIQHRPELAIVTQMCCSLPAGLHDDSQCQGLPERIFFYPHSLRRRRCL